MVIDLKTFGLPEKEERVYGAILGFSPATVSEIANLAKINRTTGYDILKKLMVKGLISISQKQGKQLYLAEPPEKLIKYINQKAQLWHQRLIKAQTLLPQLKELYRVTEKHPMVKYYEGLEGLKVIYEDSLKTRATIRAYASIEDLQRVLPEYAESYFKRRAKKRIFIRSIAKTNDYTIYLKRVQDKFWRQVRLVPPDKFNFTLERYIYDDKVSYLSFREKFGVIIESKEIAESEKAFFELAWESAKKYDLQEERKLKNHKLKNFKGY